MLLPVLGFGIALFRKSSRSLSIKEAISQQDVASTTYLYSTYLMGSYSILFSFFADVKMLMVVTTSS